MPRPLIQLGDSGPDVLEAKLRLNLAGASPQLYPSEDFDKPTEDATKAFQAAHGLAADGDIGADTWTLLDTLGGQRLLSALDVAGVLRTRDAARDLLKAGDFTTAKATLDVEYAKPQLPPEVRSTIAAGLSWAEHGLGNWDRARDLLLEAHAIVSWFPGQELVHRDFVHRLREITLRQPPGPLPSAVNAQLLP